LDFASIVKLTTTGTAFTGTVDLTLPTAAAQIIVTDPSALISGNTFVLKKAGLYSIYGKISVPADTSPIVMSVYVNGVAVVSSKQMISGTRADRNILYEGMLAVGDIVSFRYTVASGSYYFGHFYVRQVW